MSEEMRSTVELIYAIFYAYAIYCSENKRKVCIIETHVIRAQGETFLAKYVKNEFFKLKLNFSSMQQLRKYQFFYIPRIASSE